MSARVQTRSELTARQWWALGGLTYLVGLLLLVAVSRAGLAEEFYTDEAWRVDIIRSPDPLARYRTVDAPIPPAWLVLMRIGTALVPDGFAAIRMLGLAFAALFPMLAGLLVANLVLDRHARRTSIEGQRFSSALVASLAVATACVLVAYAMDVGLYINDYLFQAAAVAGFVLIWYLCDRGRLPRWVIGLMFPVLPLATISGMFVLPAASIWLFWPFRCLSARQVVQRAVAPLAGLLVAGWVYVVLYRPQVTNWLKDFWADEVVQVGESGLRSNVLVVLRSFASSVVPHSGGVRDSALVGAVVVVLAVIGQLVIAKVWAWWVASGISVVAGVVVFSVVASWPATSVRVNYPVVWLWVLSALVGVVVTAASALPGQERLWFGVAGVLPLLLLLPTPPEGPSEGEPIAFYPRGIYADVRQVVAASPRERNLVVSYHELSHFATHDALVNLSHGAHKFTVVGEGRGDDPRFVSLDDDVTPPGTAPYEAAWCVIPYDAGPEKAERVCQLTRAGWTRAVEHRGNRALIIGWYRN